MVIKRNNPQILPVLVAHPAETATAIISSSSKSDDDDTKKKKGWFVWYDNHHHRHYYRVVPIMALTLIMLVVVVVPMNQQQQTAKELFSNYHNHNHDTISIVDDHDHEEDDDHDHPQFALARKQSFGFFYDITNEHWNLHRQLYLQHVNHRYPDKPLTYHPEAREEDSVPEIYAHRNSEWKGWSSYEAWYQTNYEPNFSCPFETRVGEPMNGDGPKWVCDPHRIQKLAHERKKKDPNHPGCVIYSIGSNGDFTFEMGLQNTVGKGVCEFHIFDFGDFENLIPPELQRAKYHRWGLKKQDEPIMAKADSSQLAIQTGSKSFYGLRDTIRMLGHEKLDVIDIFKIDCENCEWETYTDWLSEDVPLLHQIQVELHRAPVMEGTGGAIDFFDSMEHAGYLRFHKEPNIQWGSDCIEYSFIKVEKSFMEGKKPSLLRHEE